jgi:hypothetical protein
VLHQERLHRRRDAELRELRLELLAVELLIPGPAHGRRGSVGACRQYFELRERKRAEQH